MSLPTAFPKQNTSIEAALLVSSAHAVYQLSSPSTASIVSTRSSLCWSTPRGSPFDAASTSSENVWKRCHESTWNTIECARIIMVSLCNFLRNYCCYFLFRFFNRRSQNSGRFSRSFHQINKHHDRPMNVSNSYLMQQKRLPCYLF